MVERRYAGPIRRGLAFTFDALLIVGVLRLFMPGDYYPQLIDLRIAAIIGALILYEGLMTHYIGSTVGKIITGAHVVEHEFSTKPSIIKSIMRPWAKLAFGLPILNFTALVYLFIAYLLFNFAVLALADNHRAIHDVVASTDVIKA